MAMGAFKREVNFARTEVSLFYVLVSCDFADNIFGFCSTGLYLNRL
jgi:hypothetical protein